MVMSLLALATIVPAVVQSFRPHAARDGIFWAALAMAVVGPLTWSISHSADHWQTGFAATLWTTISATMVLFAAVALCFRQAWRLTWLIALYMLCWGAAAVVWQQAHGHPLVADRSEGPWINAHIATAVTTYALVTIAAVAAFAAFLQERALKRKRATGISRHLPSIADCERLQWTLLAWGEGVLAAGLATGMALEFRETGRLLLLNHKSVLTLAAFIVIGLLLFAQRRSGVRGRQAARIALLGYLLLTLGYPGVKFVTDVLMSS